MNESATIIDTYLEAYGEPDATARRALIERAWAPGGELGDPPMDAAGHDAIDAMFAPDGSVALSGLDVASFDHTGRLQRVTGFFGELPARSA